PGDLLGPDEEDAADDDAPRAVRVSLRVSEPERASPGAPEDHPALDPELLAQALHVADEVPGGVVLERGVGPALARAPLVEEPDPVRGGAEEAPRQRPGPAAGPAVNEDDGHPVGIPALLVVELVDRRDLEIPLLIRLDLRIEFAHGPPYRSSRFKYWATKS